MVIIMLPFAGAFTVIDCSRPLPEGIAIQIGPLTCSTPSWAAASEAKLHTRVIVAARTTLRIFMEISSLGCSYCSGVQAAQFAAYQGLSPSALSLPATSSLKQGPCQLRARVGTDVRDRDTAGCFQWLNERRICEDR